MGASNWYGNVGYSLYSFILAAKGHHWMAFVGIGFMEFVMIFLNCECNVYRPFSTS